MSETIQNQRKSVRVPCNDVVLALDFSLRNTGYALIENANNKAKILGYGVIETEATKDDVAEMLQIRFIFNQVSELIDRHNVDVIVIECPHFARDFKSAVTVGVCLSLIAYLKVQFDNCIPVFQFKGKDVRNWLKSCTNRKTITKQNSIDFCGLIKGHVEFSFAANTDGLEHCADAVCAFYYAIRYKYIIWN